MRVCAAGPCENSLEGRHPSAIYCSTRCQHWMRRRRLGMREIDAPLSPYWREYLRRFDAALLERTPENWRRFRELSPESSGRGRPYWRELAALIRSLEVTE